ncbi:TMEM43 family protein [Cognatilysobacter terrigena]|uniref:TMEM43 family protein n=1 Tax=Cognatilysobacter terrigena TaxID=2488749 RepID=UPI0010615E88|nr:TMEM43 family protein [Lysobacter terrigena]
MRPIATLALAALFAAGIARADVAPENDPAPSNALEDPDFHVGSKQFGLERRVEMFQWTRADDGRYGTIWNAAPIASDEFDAQHRNPSKLPIRNRQWWVDSVSLDGRPLPIDVVRLLGQWQTARPNFSRLPADLGASFQPEGDGLASSYNPLAPEIGDVRITWHEFVLPPLAGKVELRDGVWQLSAKVAAAPAVARPAIDIAAAARKPAMKLRPWLIAIAVVALAGLWFLTRAITGGKT